MLSNDILQKIQTKVRSLAQPSSDIEFEVKFGSFNYYRKFESHVDFKQYDRLKKKFDESSLPHSKVHITDYIASNIGIRKQVLSTEDGEESVIFQRKNRIQNFEVPEYDIRVSLNTESNVSFIEDFIHDHVRIKDRDTYIYKNHFQIDMTKVSSIPSSKESETFEVEIEVLDVMQDTQSKMITLNKLLKFVFLILYDTNRIYTMKERRRMSSQVNQILGVTKGSTLKYGMVAKARNLKFRDLTYGAILDRVEDQTNKTDYYTVTHKADGIRKFLIINPTGIWLCFPPTECNLVVRFTKETYDPSLNGLILDGEYIPKEVGYRKAKLKNLDKVVGLTKDDENPLTPKDLEYIPSSKYWFLVFDVLSVDRNKDVQFLPHSERMKRAYRAIHTIDDIIDNNTLVVHFKTFHALTDVNVFYETMQRMFQEKDLLPYSDDGLIFMSGLAPYNPIGLNQRQNKVSIPLHKRNLHDYADICKWKPPDQLTIDFTISRKGDGTIVLYSLNNKDKSLVPFQGTNNNIFDPIVQINHEQHMIRNLPSGTIVEMKWDHNTDRFIAIKIRHDKLYPNTIVVAKDVWSDIHNPITKETLLGKNFTLLRKLHNQYKRDIFSKLDNANVKTIIDIGSGRGGDVMKWKPFDKILAVEPNEEHIQELERRIYAQGMEDKVRIINTTGQDTETIVREAKSFLGGKADAVTMMLSMSFFWQNEDILKSLVQTIKAILKSDGYFAYLLMNGDVVEEMLQSYYPSIMSISPESNDVPRLEFQLNEYNEPYAFIELQPSSEVVPGNGRQVKIYIKDSIVGNVLSNKTSSKNPSNIIKLPVLKPVIKDIKVSENPALVEIGKDVSSYENTHEDKKENSIIPQIEWLVHLNDFDRLIGKENLSETMNIFQSSTTYKYRTPILNRSQRIFDMLYNYNIINIK